MNTKLSVIQQNICLNGWITQISSPCDISVGFGEGDFCKLFSCFLILILDNHVLWILHCSCREVVVYKILWNIGTNFGKILLNILTCSSDTHVQCHIERFWNLTKNSLVGRWSCVEKKEQKTSLVWIQTMGCDIKCHMM